MPWVLLLVVMILALNLPSKDRFDLPLPHHEDARSTA